ncbi:MAG: WecB/TagA/CpsF family glycosyltransferase [Clostridiales bacterium]|nr:WecB/TagA/CpsF family glycosyltransferase [Clostridiales bacterium]
MRFLNTEIDNITFEEALAWIELHLDSTAAYIVTPNIDHIVRLETDTEFQKAYQGASLVLTDGQPLIWISKWLGTPIKEKISGSDLFPRVCRLAAKKGYRMYFLGAAPGVADMAAQKLKASCPGLQVVGTCSPEYGFEKDEGRVREIWRDIHQTKPDILIAALGTPKQEIFLWQYQDELQGMLGIGIGAGLDFAAGNVTRAPRWMQKCGLEWFYRLCHEPKRLFKRYLVDDLKILPIVWKYRK